MRNPRETALVDGRASWVTWCCPYCGGFLESRGQGLYCAAEDRRFATHSGVHRLLPEERRLKIRPFLELYQKVRRDEGWRGEPGLPDVPPQHAHSWIWRQRARNFRRGMDRVTTWLGTGPWRVLDVGAGCCWAAARLLQKGHMVVAVDVNLDPDDGLLAADRLLVPFQHSLPREERRSVGKPLATSLSQDSGKQVGTALAEPGSLHRAEAEMEALPLPPRAFDLVVAAGSLHYTRDLAGTLLELARVTRKDGMLLVLDSPVFRRPCDGEAMVADRMREHLRKYVTAASSELQSSYLLRGNLEDTFGSVGWKLEVHGWPHPLREWAEDLRERVRHGRPTARFPVLVARRERESGRRETGTPKSA